MWKNNYKCVVEKLLNKYKRISHADLPNKSDLTILKIEKKYLKNRKMMHYYLIVIYFTGAFINVCSIVCTFVGI